ncbi:52 kDa repressor of the inhibitor of the protein kinase [Eumeta japonica]|uniref:52 kDa repressor of the inhibitor of the protein kinase n=1 Tax=Eumeta variegata TaxID=151549 RepID=A0A4C1W201_EUMVA|nr:52 kDa repressor of the inhibitor of the protein kinase [Eumeta japonica]
MRFTFTAQQLEILLHQMDIRKFFERVTTREKGKKGLESSSGSDENDNHDKTHVMPRSLHANIGQALHSPTEPVNISVADYSSPSTSQQTYDVNVDPEIIVDDGYHENDLGLYVGLATQLSTEKKRELLQNPWIPPRNYDFQSDASHLKRKFNHAWLDQYAPWLVYSKRLKGALCKHCVLFPPPVSTRTTELKSHLEKCRRNAVYTSPKIQNELINLCGEVIKENIISEVQKTMAYAVLADETADVAGKEQLSIGVRFYDESKRKIREEYVGFVELKAQNASAIAEAINNFLISFNLPTEDCVGFGFNGCSTMAGKEGGVQAILRKKYPRALYFHCSSPKLNLVVNDANAVPEIRNTVATVKDVITFFRESTTCRNYAPNISRLCETRWSEKYKSIRKFSQHFPEVVKSLETLSVEGNYATRKSAYQLHSAVTKPVFIVALQTIAKYSAVLEPVVNGLKAKSIDMISVGNTSKISRTFSEMTASFLIK